MNKFFLFCFFTALCGIFNESFAQGIEDTTDIVISYTTPEELTIGGITISGAEFLDANALISVTNLKVGDKLTIPGEQVSIAIKKLWDQGLIGDIQVSGKKVGKTAYINFHLKERPRLSKFDYKGIKKGDHEELNKKVDIARGRIVNDALIKNARKKIRDYYVEKGFLNTVVNITPVKDSALPNNVILQASVNKKHRVRIDNIIIKGNNSVTNPPAGVPTTFVGGLFSKQKPAITRSKLLRRMKKTKEKDWYKIFTTSKLIRKEYEEDKQNIINYYNTQGYRDAAIVYDSVIEKNEKYVDVVLNIEEGRKYYFRNITWKGNFVHDEKTLNAVLNIKKGDVYNLENLQKRLSYNPQGFDVSSLYLDDGYLFFNVEPVEVLIEGDSIDLEMRIFEGTQATIENVIVSGNTKTHDHVILREVRTIPGQKFSRSDLIRSTRELAALGYFDQEELMSNGVTPIPNPEKGTVDIHYKVVEKPSDQIELSGGWGGYYGFVGTLGLTFNNFSAQNITKFKTWSPLPSGDGQKFSVRFQANGPSYQNYSTSFTEPWLGGKKPISLTVALSHSRTAYSSNNPYGGLYGSTYGLPVRSGDLNSRFFINNATVAIGQRVRWPDDYFTLSNSVSYLQYQLRDYPLGQYGNMTGRFNNLTLGTSIARNSIDDFTFPTSGSNMNLSVSLTPPYSLFDSRDFSKLAFTERSNFIEYHKWMFDNAWYTTLIPGKKRNLVLSARTHFGFIGSYKKTTPVGPFERFVMGGSGLSGAYGGSFIFGSEIIGLRGYDNNVIYPAGNGGLVYNKLVAELRYPVNISPAFSLFVLGFFESGNAWSNLNEFNPFNNYRSAGIGARIFMPAFGLIGIDFGQAFDNVPGRANGGRNAFTFTIGQQLR